MARDQARRDEWTDGRAGRASAARQLQRRFPASPKWRLSDMRRWPGLHKRPASLQGCPFTAQS